MHHVFETLIIPKNPREKQHATPEIVIMPVQEPPSHIEQRDQSTDGNDSSSLSAISDGAGSGYIPADLVSELRQLGHMRSQEEDFREGRDLINKIIIPHVKFAVREMLTHDSCIAKSLIMSMPRYKNETVTGKKWMEELYTVLMKMVKYELCRNRAQKAQQVGKILLGEAKQTNLMRLFA